MIAFTCPACNQRLGVKEEWIGKPCRCTRCGHVAEVKPPSEAPRPTATGLADATVAARAAGATAGGEQPTVPGYTVLEELGRGGMGVVYKAQQVKLKRLVALKMILGGAHVGDAELARFRSEAEAVARVAHPNIVQIYEVGEHNQLPYFSLELVEGGSLDRKLAGQPLPFREAAELLQTLARAVHAAHQQGVVHRDLKPSNVLLTKDGQPKITDFGLAKRIDTAQDHTRTGSILGTPSYLAPEQAAGKKDLGPSADVYSLGAMLYEFLTGRPPFRGETAMDTVLMVVFEEPVPPVRLRPRVPRDLETICLKCLEKDPVKRYASASALADDLQRYLSGEPIQARPLGRPEQAWRWCRRNPVAASLLLAVTLGSAFGLWFLSRLSTQLVHMTAIESAAQQADMLDGVNSYYSSHIVRRVRPFVTVTHDYEAVARRDNVRTIPIPATMTIELGEEISKQKSGTGVKVRLYSDLPFKTRKDGGPRDKFERDALEQLRKHPTDAVWSFEEIDNKPVLRYARARRMQADCVSCHNNHPDSPRNNWKEGDMRGVLEIIRPLDKDIERTNEGLRGGFLMIGALSVTLLGVSSLVLLVSNRRRRQSQLGAAA